MATAIFNWISFFFILNKFDEKGVCETRWNRFDYSLKRTGLITFYIRNFWFYDIKRKPIDFPTYFLFYVLLLKSWSWSTSAARLMVAVHLLHIPARVTGIPGSRASFLCMRNDSLMYFAFAAAPTASLIFQKEKQSSFSLFFRRESDATWVTAQTYRALLFFIDPTSMANEAWSFSNKQSTEWWLHPVSHYTCWIIIIGNDIINLSIIRYMYQM